MAETLQAPPVFSMQKCQLPYVARIPNLPVIKSCYIPDSPTPIPDCTDTQIPIVPMEAFGLSFSFCPGGVKFQTQVITTTSPQFLQPYLQVQVTQLQVTEANGGCNYNMHFQLQMPSACTPCETLLSDAEVGDTVVWAWEEDDYVLFGPASCWHQGETVCMTYQTHAYKGRLTNIIAPQDPVGWGFQVQLTTKFQDTGTSVTMCHGVCSPSVGVPGFFPVLIVRNGGSNPNWTYDCYGIDDTGFANKLNLAGPLRPLITFASKYPAATANVTPATSGTGSGGVGFASAFYNASGVLVLWEVQDSIGIVQCGTS